MELSGKLLIIIGLVIVGVGLLLYYFDRIPLVGKMPGDILIKRDGFTFYFPLVTSILLSIIISIVIRLFHR